MLETVSTFVAVATAGSFSSVAKAQGAAVSSITRRVELLEADLQAKLFIRSSRRLTLTDAGQNFLPRARNLLAEPVRSQMKNGRRARRARLPTNFHRGHERVGDAAQ